MLKRTLTLAAIMVPRDRQAIVKKVLMFSLSRIFLNSILHLVLHKTAKLNRVTMKNPALFTTKFKPSALRQEKGTEQRTSTRMKRVAAEEAAVVNNLKGIQMRIKTKILTRN